MKTLPICVFIGICFITKGASETIKCYVCDNCNDLNDSQLKSCPPQGATNPPVTKNPTTLFTESSTKSTEEPTSESTVSELEIITTAFSPKPTQIVTDPPKMSEPITEDHKIETTTMKTQETEPTETNRPITNESKQTTVPSSSVTEIPTNGIPESTETFQQFTTPPKSSSMGSSEINNPTNGMPEVTPGKIDPVEEIASSIVVSPIVSTDSPELLAGTVAPEAPESMISLPPVAEVPSQSYNPEALNSIEPESLIQPSQYYQPYPIFNRIPRAVQKSRSAPSYHCYSINILDGDTRKVKKGCIEVPEDKAACDVLKNDFGKSVDKCKICTEDKCNSCSTLKYSIITLVMVLVVSFY